MKSRESHKQSRHPWLAGGVVSLLTALIGLSLLVFPIGGGLTRLSFDLPFALRGDLPVTNVAIVYLDEVSHEELKQPTTAPWDRSLHAQLIDQLTMQGAKAIVFDILFTDPSANPVADAQFARSIKVSGRVILCGNLNLLGDTTSKSLPIFDYTPAHESEPFSEECPYEPFCAGTVAWGNANLAVDPDYGIRSFYPAFKDPSRQASIPWLPAAVAKFAGATEGDVRSDTSESRWLNYYGPPGSIPSVSYFLAVLTNGVPPGFFKDKIVFIGAQMSADFSGKGKDEFLTPYAYWGKGFAPGVEIHATAALNMIQHNWLNRLPPLLELAVVLLFAVTVGGGLIRLQPLIALAAALAGTVLVAAVAHWLAWHWHWWFAWLILVCELWVALLCSVIYNSLRLYVERKLLEQSLAAHLSPKIVKRLLNDPALRKLGGTQQEVSIIFTDVANFSRISETMQADDLVRLMNKYFETALACIHETDGTVVKLIGDAIFAIWNAPLAQPDHRERACRAAWLLREKIVEFDSSHLSVPLRTRVGLHAGEACVGNIGSASRFDYTALGESINLTSRLEGLNKFLGTSVLATREAQRAVEQALVWRMVGHFRLKGLGRVVEVYELVGPQESAGETKPWCDEFAQALHEFSRRQFDSAAEKFQRTIELRRKNEPQITAGTTAMDADGPSRFYLDKIEEFRDRPPTRDWIGEVELNEK